MSDVNILKLVERPHERSLDGLSGDVWRKLDEEVALVRQRKIILGAQLGILVVFWFYSFTVFHARDFVSVKQFAEFSPRGVPAPSALLLGNGT